jgi:hypothetical protein
VKKAFKISGSIFTAVLYSMVILLLAQNIPLPDSSDSEIQPIENQVKLTAVPADIFSDPLIQEPAFYLLNVAKYSASDFQHKTFLACLKLAEKSISNDFVQYIFLAKNFPVKLRKADLLFPFHYFW